MLQNYAEQQITACYAQSVDGFRNNNTITEEAGIRPCFASAPWFPPSVASIAAG